MVAPLFAGVGLVTVLTLSGCRKSPPPVVEVEGTVLLDGKPLPQAQVEFAPQLSNFGAELNSTGITDDKGHFTLTCSLGGQSGAVVAKHRVLVTEPPTPDEYRSQDPKTLARYKQYLEKLTNRPIPAAYGNLAKTPLVVEVKAGQKTYDLNLTRNP
jgi:hypothetical protein